VENLGIIVVIIGYGFNTVVTDDATPRR